MYEVPRTHSQLATLQPAGLAALNWSKRPAVPPLPWSSPLMMTTAFLPFGKYQNRGSGFLTAFIRRIRFASSRCCSSACGIATLLRSTQSGWTSPILAPKNLSSERIGVKPSRSCAAHAGLPWRVVTTDSARSNANAAALPVPVLFSVTAGLAVAVLAVL